jgi:hypothetical protein
VDTDRLAGRQLGRLRVPRAVNPVVGTRPAFCQPGTVECCAFVAEQQLGPRLDIGPRLSQSCLPDDREPTGKGSNSA